MKRLLLCLALLLLLPACAPKEARQQFFAMDTTMTVTLYGSRDDALLTQLQQEVFRLEGLFSRTRTGSDIARLNQGAGQKVGTELDPDTAALLERSLAISSLTGGALDVTIAPAMDAWGFGGSDSFQTSPFRVPDPEELAELLPLVGMERLELDGSAARLDRAGMAVDLGAVAKGYAADRIQALLTQAGVTSALLDLGGNVTVLGTNPDGDPWRVGIKDPLDPTGTYCLLSLSDRTLSTSGGYARNFTQDGVIYHHILDPKTGAPARSGLLAVTAVSPEGTLADGLSTACFVLGAERSLDLWRDQGQAWDFELILVDEKQRVFVTQGLEDALEPTGEEAGYTYEIVRR